MNYTWSEEKIVDYWIELVDNKDDGLVFVKLSYIVTVEDDTIDNLCRDDEDTCSIVLINGRRIHVKKPYLEMRDLIRKLYGNKENKETHKED